LRTGRVAGDHDVRNPGIVECTERLQERRSGLHVVERIVDLLECTVGPVAATGSDDLSDDKHEAASRSKMGRVERGISMAFAFSVIGCDAIPGVPAA
jgi:hypothetical protein